MFGWHITFLFALTLGSQTLLLAGKEFTEDKQLNHLPDTIILLEGTEVRGSRHSAFGLGHNTEIIDQSLIESYTDQGLDNLLLQHGGIFIKNYGPGILATSTLRGGSSAQTALIWNGFQIQSPMHGQTDLALIPVFLIDEAGIQYGGGSAMWGSGSMGGSIHINNRPSKTKGFDITAGIFATNIGGMTNQLGIAWGNDRIYTRLRMQLGNSDNSYRFRNTSLYGSPVQVQENAAGSQTALMYETYINFGNRNLLELIVWWQDSERSIPPPMAQPYAGAFQKDDALRITGHWQKVFDKFIFNWRGGIFDESIWYDDNFTGERLSGSLVNIHEAELIFSPLTSLTVNTGLNAQLNRARADDYNDRSYRQHSYAVFNSLKWEAIPGKIDFLLSVRQELVDGDPAPFAPTLGLSYLPRPSVNIRANAGRSYRIPTINDRYWSPGGNPELEAERGWSQDLVIAWENPDSENIAEKSENYFMILDRGSLTGYHKKISEWIIWTPSEASMYWTPQNVHEVRSYGLEARLGLSAQAGRTACRIDLSWDHTIAENTRARSAGDRSAGKQLIYVPKNNLGAAISLEHGSFGLFLNHRYTGRRYTASDNSRWLAPYHNGDGGIHWSLKTGNYSLRLSAGVYNLWNQAYEVVSGRPMPLRHFRAGVRLGFTDYN